MERITAEEYQKLRVKWVKPNKYGALKATVDGIPFHSKREAERYCELKILEKADEIRDLELQLRFELQPKIKLEDGKVIRAITYIADFRYREAVKPGDWRSWREVVEDVKSSATQTVAYKIKKKIFLYEYPELTFREVF